MRKTLGFFRPAAAAVLVIMLLGLVGIASSGCATVYKPTVQQGTCAFDRVWTPPYQDAQGKWHEGYCREPGDPAPGS